MSKLAIMCVSCVLASAAIGSPASAELAGVWHGEARANDIFIGSILLYDAVPFQAIVNVVGNTCEISQMGLDGLGGDWRIYLSEEDDYLDILRDYDRPILLDFCNFDYDLELGPLHYHGATVTVYGGGGNDEIRGGDGITWIAGGDGDDTLYSGCADGSEIHGGAGNDTMYGCWQSISEVMYGDEGDDTFCEYWDDLHFAKLIVGDDGFDRINPICGAATLDVEALTEPDSVCP